jgi:mannose-6-phosphate isomerase-like protein (cupin superfamily)
MKQTYPGMVANMARDMMIPEPNCHDGVGTIFSFRAFDHLLSDQKVDFIDFVRIPPGTSIGRHFHGDNHEWYVIISGEGEMFFKGETLQVHPWDVLINPPHHEHGLTNNSTGEIVLVVFETTSAAKA